MLSGILRISSVSRYYILLYTCAYNYAISISYRRIRHDRNLRRYVRPLVTVTLVPATGFN